MTVCEDLMEERKKLWNATRSLSAARADVPSERRTRKSQILLYTRRDQEQPPKLITFGFDVECIDFVGDSAKESCQHIILPDTSNFDGHDSRGKEKETGARG